MLYLEHLKIRTQGGFPVLIFQDKMGKELSLRVASIKITRRLVSYILDLELFIIRLVGWVPLHWLRLGVYLLAGVKIGRNTHLHMGTQFFDPQGIEIGEGTVIGQNAFLDGRDSLIIGNHVDIASDVLIYNSEHNINSVDFEPITAPVEIGDYCFIGPRVIILPGVTIGRGAVVAAGGVVTKNVEPFAIVGGVPAKVIGERQVKEPHYQLGRSRLFQ